MKGAPYLALALAMLLGAEGVGAAPDDEPKENAIVADLGLHVVNVGYQRTVTPALVLQASAGLYVPWLVNRNVLGLAGEDHDPPGDVAGLVLRLRPFFFPSGHAPTALWVSPFVQGGPVRATHDGQTLSGTSVAAGASLGYSFALGARGLLGVGLGAQYHRVSVANSTDFPGFSRFGPTADLNLGYGF